MLAELVSSGSRSVDELIVGAGAAMVSLCGMSAYELIWLHHDFSPVTFATGAAAIIGAAGGAMRARDGLSTPPKT